MMIRCSTMLVLLVLTPASPGTARAAQSQPVRVIEITAERFQFWPSEVVVQEGEEVELRLRSDDTNHGFRIVGQGTNLQIPKRGHGYVAARFTGSTPGRYTFECNRICGAGHHFMRGELVVEPTAAPGNR